MPVFDVTVKGMALEDKGLTDGNTVDGLGLVTYGLIWGCDNIWYTYYSSNTLASNTWTLYLGLTVATTWSLCAGASVVTNWSLYTTQGIENC